jgi:hypothetical protein
MAELPKDEPFGSSAFYLAFLMFLSVGIITGFDFISDIQMDKDFAERYREYQQTVRSGKVSFNKKDHHAVIEHYTAAIEISPYLGSHYYGCGIVW